MALLERPRYADVHWLPLLLALAVTAVGLAFVASATSNPDQPGSWGSEARMQMIWLTLSLTVCAGALHIAPETWRQLAVPAFLAALATQFFMIVMAGSSLVPNIKGQHNWIAIGRLRLQPSEFMKLATLLMAAWLLTRPGNDPRHPLSTLAVLAIAGLPAALLLREDLGSALTFGPMLIGVLLVAGMPLSHLLGLILSGSAVIGLGIARMSREGYQWRRIQAWLNPEDYALTEGFQTLRSLRSIGSGQLTGKGYGVGDQNLLGWLPEKHTDMIFAVIGEELGFVGAGAVIVLLLIFCLSLLWAALRCREPFSRLVVAGFACLVMGQVTINLAVVLGLMPVTGITLPFISYGGSSLLGLYLGLGACLALTAARQRSFGRGTFAGL